jgi:hypothetical protein
VEDGLAQAFGAGQVGGDGLFGGGDDGQTPLDFGRIADFAPLVSSPILRKRRQVSCST